MRILIAVVFMAILGGQTVMAENFQFDSIDGGTMSMSDWRGQPVLVVNTASQCGFTYQYEALQQLHETYRDKGLVVLAVPSDDFNQELSDAAAVKDFCTVNFGLDVPMTTITKVRGDEAHPFFLWLNKPKAIDRVGIFIRFCWMVKARLSTPLPLPQDRCRARLPNRSKPC